MCQKNLDALLGLREAGDIYVEQVTVHTVRNTDPLMSIMSPMGGTPQHMLTEEYCTMTINFRCTPEQAKTIIDTMEAGQTCVL